MIERRRAIMSDNIVPDDAIIIAKRSANEKALMDVIFAQGWSESPSFMRKAEAEMVTSIGTAFKGNTKITDFSAFKYFTSVTTLGSAFNECYNLASITLPPNLETINGDTFERCRSLRYLSFPDSVTSITGNFVLNRCGVKHLHFGKGLATMSFSYYYGLDIDSITVDVENPKFSSYDGCNGLFTNSTLILGCKNTTFPPHITAIGKGAFEQANVGNLYIPNTIKSYGDSCLRQCNINATLELPSGSTLGEFCFYNSPNLDLIIPETIGDIKTESLRGSKWFNKQEDGVVYCNDFVVGYRGTYDPVVTIREGSRIICNEAFEDCSGITSIKIPASVKEIRAYAFNRCSNLVIADIDGSPYIGVTKVFVNTNKLEICIFRGDSVVNIKRAQFTTKTTFYVKDTLVQSFISNNDLSADRVKPLSELPDEYK